jgi:hypothetical protein
MIRSLTNILELFIQKEKELVKKYHIINHPVMIGEMYEGMTKDVLAQIILPNLDLRVVSGKILSSDKVFSKQIDCMLVVGEGNKIPHTNNYIYSIDNVIAVIEVKKNLFSKEIEDAFSNLNSFYRWVQYEKLSETEKTILFNAFSTIFYGIKIHDDIEDQTLTEKMTYYNLIMDAVNPVRCIWAYEGLKTEENLRRSLLNLIDKNVGESGFQPFNFPDLIICQNSTIVKANGMPYGLPFSLTGIWPFICTSDKNPLYFLISQIWYRLIYRFNLSHKNIFEEFFFSTEFTPFIGALISADDKGTPSWFYYNTDEKSDFYRYNDVPFSLIDKLQLLILIRLFKEPFIDCEKDAELGSLLKANNLIVSAFVQLMLLTEVVKLDDTKIMLIDKENTGIIHIDGNHYAFLGDKEKMIWIKNKIAGKKVPFLKL